jgi:hypothetical protein
MITHNHNREKLISRVQKELIGPGSDIFKCFDKARFTDEVIEGKPLQRYFSAILFPKQVAKNGADDAQNELTDSDEDDILLGEDNTQNEPTNENGNDTEGVDKEEGPTTQPQYTANTFFPSQFGLSFCVSKDCHSVDIEVSFGNYKKAKFDEIILPYAGTDILMLSEFGFDNFVQFDEENQCLKLKKELDKDDRKDISELMRSMRKDHRNHTLLKHLTKLFFKDKYKRFHNDSKFTLAISDIQNNHNQHIRLKLSEYSGKNTEDWYSGKVDGKQVDLKDHLWLHLKLYSQNQSKFFVKAVIENTFILPQKRTSNTDPIHNAVTLFQTEIKVSSPCFLPFNDYQANFYKSDEDRMLDYLFRNQLAYGVGHNSACTWEDCGNNIPKPSWISTTFLPEYDVKSQSTETDKIQKDILLVKNLSTFGNDKTPIIANLQQVTNAYSEWISNEEKEAKGDELALKNIEKCKKIYNRICKGVSLLGANTNAFRAFQLANTAIYLQMFQNEWHFSNKKDGYEAYERTELQYDYELYGIADYPNGKPQPAWRPFQLAFILQCIPSFVEENSEDLDLVDLLYFPTGGGKTEAYLAVSAFLIFWRRLQHPNAYGGVNVIIRYTLRLLSAQQFERATKLILACEYIRQNHKDLGNEKITIGFWVGDATIPNTLDTAQRRLTNTQKRLNEGKESINPFQLTNCQWCNTKIISKNQAADKGFIIGHRIINDKKLLSTCLNPHCNYHNELPIVVVDEDIYSNPPTILFATVDKFAILAWKGEATNLFNFKENRKPELIIQDELHLLNGPLGSLVGLFENVVLSLCTTSKQRPKIIASTATVKNVEKQIEGLYGRRTAIFPQYATNADDTFFSKTQSESKRRYIGILPTGKTNTMTSLRLNAALLLARLEIWENDKKGADAFWTILSYFKSLKEIGRFSNKITAELQPEIQQLQVRHLKNYGDLPENYRQIPWISRHIELTSRIANEKIKKNLDKLEVSFEGDLKTRKALDIALATNMISVGLDVKRLNIMLMNGMPPNTAEYIQASSRVARNTEGVVFTLYDPNNTRDLSYFEDFVPFHKTFYKQVGPLSVTPFAENALDKMLFTVMVSYFRHKLGFASNNMANALAIDRNKQQLISEFKAVFEKHTFATVDDKIIIMRKIENFIEAWKMKLDASPANGLFFYGGNQETTTKKNLLIPIQEKKDADIRIAMQSMRSVEPSSEILIKQC